MVCLSLISIIHRLDMITIITQNKVISIIYNSYSHSWHSKRFPLYISSFTVTISVPQRASAVTWLTAAGGPSGWRLAHISRTNKKSQQRIWNIYVTKSPFVWVAEKFRVCWTWANWYRPFFILLRSPQQPWQLQHQGCLLWLTITGRRKNIRIIPLLSWK